MGAARQQEATVVIQPVEDLHVGVVSQPPVDEVRLPHLVWLGGLETDVAASRTLAGLRDDQGGLVQDPADRGGREDPKPLLLQMPADRLRASIQPIGAQLQSQLQHSLTELWGVALEDPLGRLERGSTASRPPAR